MFKKILIANRGEVALRIIRACQELNIPTVLVYSEADKDSMPVRLSDEAICIGPPQPKQSYLNTSSIISAAQVSGADAIHPGYGFLAENPEFAEVCESSRIVFIGPPAGVIRKMGEKAQAKKSVGKAGVPVVPGTDGVIKSEREALAFGEKYSYPVIVKAAMGGGGRGMRIVKNKNQLVKSVQMAAKEAEAAFGSTKVYLEKYIEEPRHVEFQILADNFGNTVHLGERDCSIQRRHQKLIEEAPSVALSAERRQEMGKLAVEAAKAVDYRNAGTVEFLIDAKGSFYFMEMNTRVQVEHPVTEMTTGVDIIKQQIRIAAGEKLKITQETVDCSGHSIEYRINAEDPDNNFMPSCGKVQLFNPPGGPGVRTDSHLYSGYVVPSHYDSLLAKLVIWGEDRNEAIARSKRALKEFTIVGIKTTIPFYLKVIDNPMFKKGKTDTHFIDKLAELF